MKKTLVILFALTLIGVFAVNNCAQSRTNRIYRPCPNTAVTARVEVQTDGDIDLVPCVGRSVLVNGSPTSNTITFSGTDRTNFFPAFSTETNLARSPFSWNGTTFNWNNLAADSEFKMLFAPSTGAGTFLVGDYEDTGQNFFRIGQNGILTLASSWEATLDGPIHMIGDVTGRGNQLYLSINDATNTFSFTSGGLNAAINFGGVSRFLLLRTVTTGGTTGNQIINRPAGTVNFAPAATAITVTNSVVNTASIVLAVTRTNDATCSVKNVVAGAGSFVINMTAACTAETSVGFLVLN
jgi:hypothetical protein